MTQARVSDRTATVVLTIDRIALNLAHHWLLYFEVFFGILVITPFFAPIFMAIGATGLAGAIYGFYSLLCHQLPQRSFFLFGHSVSYNLAQINVVYPFDNYFTLRQFIGNEAMGWKVAWSDRMIGLYGSIWVGGLLYAWLRKRGIPRLPILVWILLGIVPMGVDGFSHMINDAVAGISGTGFRDTNAWLVALTGNALPASFYAGDALGSFNNLARLITGTLTGLTSVWVLFPYVDSAMQDIQQGSERQLNSPRAVELGFARAPAPASNYTFPTDYPEQPTAK